jgi:hypothetical protein
MTTMNYSVYDNNGQKVDWASLPSNKRLALAMAARSGKMNVSFDGNEKYRIKNNGATKTTFKKPMAKNMLYKETGLEKSANFVYDMRTAAKKGLSELDKRDAELLKRVRAAKAKGNAKNAVRKLARKKAKDAGDDSYYGNMNPLRKSINKFFGPKINPIIA